MFDMYKAPDSVTGRRGFMCSRFLSIMDLRSGKWAVLLRGSVAGGCALHLLLICLFLLLPAPAQAAKPDLGELEPDARVVFLLEEARAMLRKGDPAAAVALGEKAVAETPGHPAPYFFLARVLLRQDFIGSMGRLGEGLSAVAGDFTWLLSLAGGATAMLLAAAVFASLVAWVVLLYKSVFPAVHDVRERNLDWRFLILSAATLIIGLFYPVCLLTFLLWPYFKRRERMFLAVIPVMLLSSSFLLSVVSGSLSFPSSQRAKALVRLTEERGVTRALSVLKDPETEAELFSVATAYMKLENYKKAIDTYLRIDNGWKHYSRVLNNLGVCHYRMNRLEKARSFFESALDSGLSSTRYNLSQVYRDELKFGEGDRLFRQVQEDDPDAVSAFMASGRTVVAEKLPDKTLWMLMLRENQRLENLRTAMWRPFMGPVPVAIAPIAGILVLLLFVFRDRALRKGRRAYRCWKCGEVHCGKCENRMSKDDLCNSCYLGSVRIDQADPQHRVRKMLRARKYYEDRVRKAKLLSLLPGLGSYYLGRMWSGFVLLSLFLLTIEVMFLSDYLFWVPRIFFGSLGFFIPGLLAIFCLVVVSYLIVRGGIIRGWH